MKKKMAAVLLFSLITAASLFGRPPLLTLTGDPYRLSFTSVMRNDPGVIRQILEQPEAAPFQRAILNINLILISDDLGSLDAAVEALDQVPEAERGTALYRIYRGMAEAFLARRRTIFGLKNLRNTESLMTSIPQEYDDWYIRLLRGISYYSLGQGLPGIGPMKEPKEKALTMGKRDLLYVLEEHGRNPIANFIPDDYDWDAMPVPDDAAEFALEVLLR